MTEPDTAVIAVEIDPITREAVVPVGDFANLLSAALSSPGIPTPAMLGLWSALNGYSPALAKRAYAQAWNASHPRDRLALLILSGAVPGVEGDTR